MIFNCILIFIALMVLCTVCFLDFLAFDQKNSSTPLTGWDKFVCFCMMPAAICLAIFIRFKWIYQFFVGKKKQRERYVYGVDMAQSAQSNSSKLPVPWKQEGF